jgi:hypothetical protein
VTANLVHLPQTERYWLAAVNSDPILLVYLKALLQIIALFLRDLADVLKVRYQGELAGAKPIG